MHIGPFLAIKGRTNYAQTASHVVQSVDWKWCKIFENAILRVGGKSRRHFKANLKKQG